MTVDVVDAAGVVCPLATNRVEFSVSAVVEASEASGRIAVDVRSAGLEPASLSLRNGGTHGSEGDASSGPEASSNDRLLTDGKMEKWYD